MKFRDHSDRILFLLELRGNLTHESIAAGITDSDINELFLKRGGREKTFDLKNFRRSQLSKHSWRSNKLGYLKGIGKFHRSLAGKKFHRDLTRFLLTRESYNKIDLLKSLSSLKTHLYIDMDYYRSVDESIDFEIFVEETVDLINKLEADLLAGREPNPTNYEGLLEAMEYKRILADLGLEATTEADYTNYIEHIKSKL
jgi:hypothetical protein